MKRVALILGLLIGGCALFLFIAERLVLHTAGGKSFLVGQAEAHLSKATASDVTVGSLSGSLPSEIIIRDITFSADGSAWLTIDEMRLDWQPFALLSKKIVINNGAITGASLLDQPPQKDDPEDEPVKGFTLPTSLPSVKVDNFLFRDIHIGNAVIGRDADLEGDARLQIGGRDIIALFNLKALDGKDEIALSIDRDGPSNQLVISIDAQSDGDGLVANLAALNGPLSLSLKGDAPVNAFELNMEGSAGAFADFSGSLMGNLEKLDAVLVDAEATLGTNLAAITEQLGNSVTLKASIAQQSNDVTLTVSDLTMPNAGITGVAQWKNRNDTLSAASLDSKITLSNTAFNEIASRIGNEIDLKMSLSPQGDQYRLAVETTSDKGSLALQDGATDLQTTLTGPVAININPSPALPSIFAAGVTLSTQLAYEDGIRAALSDLSIKTLNGLSVSGDAQISLVENNLTSDLDITLQPQLITEVLPSFEANAPITSSLSLANRGDGMDVTLNGQSPDATINGEALPPHSWSAKIDDVTTAPSGRFSLSSQDLGTALNGTINTEPDGTYKVSNLDYSGPGFSFKGNGDLSPKTGRAHLKTSYNGESGSSLFPGIALIGNFDAEGVLDSDGTLSFSALVPSLRFNALSIRDASLSASGPADAIAINVSADRIQPSNSLELSDLAFTGLASTVDGMRATFSAFTTIANNIPIKTNAPFTLALKEGVELSNLTASIGDQGALSGDASFAAARWQATIVADDILIPDYATAVNLDLDLDTDRETHATGRYALTSVIDEENTTLLAGALGWSGNTLTLSDDTTRDGLALDLILPASLTRGDQLGVELAGPISGKAIYDGPVAPLAALAPASVQSLEGNLDINFDISGEVNAPVVDGGFTIAEGAYTEYTTGISIVGINVTGKARSAADGAALSFKGNARGPGQEKATITTKGSIDPNASTPVDVAVNFDSTSIAGGPLESATATGDFFVKGSLNALAATGAIEIEELSLATVATPSTGLVGINVIDKNAQSDDLEEKTESTNSTISLDLKISADDKIFVRGRGLESEWTSDLTVTGTSQAPVVLGNLRVKDGFILFADRRFEISEGAIAFDRLTTNNPTLDIQAETENNDVTATIAISGRALSPKIALESSPSLPDNDALAYILFGEPANNLSALEALQVAQALASLAAIGPFGGGTGLVGSARSSLGVDLLSLDTGSDSESPSLTVGKYVADGLFVSATQDVSGENSTVRVEYEVRDNITVETELKQNGDQTVSANWKRDF